MLNITETMIKDAISSTNSMTAAASSLGIQFGTFKRYATKYNLYIPNQGLRGYKKPKSEGTKDFYSLQDILDGKHPQYQSYKLKKRLFESGIKENICEKCGVSEWQGQHISCELDHIDGNSSNHSLNNLMILCPNCHSQTETFRYKRGKGA